MLHLIFTNRALKDSETQFSMGDHVVLMTGVNRPLTFPDGVNLHVLGEGEGRLSAPALLELIKSARPVLSHY
ncbi:MAG TPA: hypothetical protein IAB18_00700 [Candidatus Avisuccinivibrio pullicola]|nr:hypothetical protein [Candidatus Avisuccinivibrio pullicola]